MTFWFPRPGTGDRFIPHHTVELGQDGELRLCRPYDPDVNDPDSQFPGDLYLGDMLHTVGVDADGDTRGEAAAIAALVCSFHEIIEWTHVDGQRTADPHPAQEDAAWDYLVNQARAMLTGCRDRFPPVSGR